MDKLNIYTLLALSETSIFLPWKHRCFLFVETARVGVKRKLGMDRIDVKRPDSKVYSIMPKRQPFIKNWHLMELILDINMGAILYNDSWNHWRDTHFSAMDSVVRARVPGTIRS